jgi:hypothetical protein
MISSLRADRGPRHVDLADLASALRDSRLDRIHVTAGQDLPAVLKVLSEHPAGEAWARLTLDLTGAALPAQADLATASRLGVERLDLGCRHSDRNDPLQLLALLRDGVELGVSITFTGNALGAIGADVTHLPEPGGNGYSTGLSWEEPHAYGRCFYRRGPGFLLVVDRRDSPEYRYTLDDADHIEAIGVLRTPTPLRETPPALKQAAADLAELNLVAVHAGRGLLLPYRLRRWPMPVDSL